VVGVTRCAEIRFAQFCLIFSFGVLVAQNMSGMGRIADAPLSPQAEREAWIAACFRDAPTGNARAHVIWLEKCLREVR
jgi:hypothetical protein